MHGIVWRNRMISLDLVLWLIIGAIAVVGGIGVTAALIAMVRSPYRG